MNSNSNSSFPGVLYGQGVYFSTDASHCAQDFINKRSSVKRYVFLAKALTGEYVKGNPSLRLPPCKTSAGVTESYHSTVDDESNPKEFVIYSDTQTYPEYLITFTI